MKGRFDYSFIFLCISGIVSHLLDLLVIDQNDRFCGTAVLARIGLNLLFHVLADKDKINVAEPQQKTATVAGKEKTFVVYDVTDESGTKLGKAVQTSENGFGGELQVLVGFDQEGTILGYTILQHAETPGLGAKAGDWFQKENGEKRTVVGKNPGKANFTVSKDGGDIDAITASTITSRAFLLAIKNAYDNTCVTDANTGATTQANK